MGSVRLRFPGGITPARIKARYIFILSLLAVLLTLPAMQGCSTGPPAGKDLLPLDEFVERAADGDVEALRRMLDAGIDPNAKDEDGDPAILAALKGGHLEAVRLLLEHGASLNVSDSDSFSYNKWLKQPRTKRGLEIEALVKGLDPIEYSWRGTYRNRRMFYGNKLRRDLELVEATDREIEEEVRALDEELRRVEKIYRKPLGQMGNYQVGAIKDNESDNGDTYKEFYQSAVHRILSRGQPRKSEPGGEYIVSRRNADRSFWTGLATINKAGSVYDLALSSADKNESAVGRLKGNSLRFDRGAKSPLVLTMGEDGSLTGLFSRGKATITFLPKYPDRGRFKAPVVFDPGTLGISVTEATRRSAGALGVAFRKGLLIANARRGLAAHKAGLRTGDIVTGLNGRPVKDSVSFLLELQKHAHGARVELALARNGEELKLQGSWQRPPPVSVKVRGRRKADDAQPGPPPYRMLPTGAAVAPALEAPFFSISSARYPARGRPHDFRKAGESPGEEFPGQPRDFFQIWNRPGALGILWQEDSHWNPLANRQIRLSWLGLGDKTIATMRLPGRHQGTLAAAAHDGKFIYYFTCWHTINFSGSTYPDRDRSKPRIEPLQVTFMTLYKINGNGELIRKREFSGIPWNVRHCPQNNGAMAYNDGELALLLDREFLSEHQGALRVVFDAESLAPKKVTKNSLSHSFGNILNPHGKNGFLSLGRGDNGNTRGIYMRKFTAGSHTGRIVFTTKMLPSQRPRYLDSPVYAPYPEKLKMYRSLGAKPCPAVTPQDRYACNEWRLWAKELNSRNNMFYKGSNHNPTHLELGNVIETPAGYLVIFTGEPHKGRALDITRFGRSRWKPFDPRNLAFVLVRKDFQNSPFHGAEVPDDLILSKGITETGEFYGYYAGIKRQRNTGVVWLTDYDQVELDNATHPKAVKLSSGNVLVLWELWDLKKYQNTLAMILGPRGEILRGPVELGPRVRLDSFEDIVLRGDDTVYIVTGVRTETTVRRQKQENHFLEVTALKIKQP